MQWCSKEHVKSATALQTPHHRQQMLLGVGGGDRELSTVGRPGTNSNYVPDKALEKAPADLLGVSFPEAQERREVGWIGVREEREGEEEKEGKRRMGDGLILGGGENEGGGSSFSERLGCYLPPPFPQWRETGGANPARLPLALKVQHPSPQAPGPATRAPIGKRLGASSDHQLFFFALFRTSRALVPTVPVVPVPVVPVPNLPFPFLAVARPAAIFDAAQSWAFFFSYRATTPSFWLPDIQLLAPYLRGASIATDSCQQHKDGGEQRDRLSGPPAPGVPRMCGGCDQAH